VSTEHEQGNGFEERLLRELRRTVADAPEPAPAVRGRRPRVRVTPGRRLAFGGGAAIAVALAAAVGVPFLSHGPLSNGAAYAVTNNGDGTVTVQINSLQDAAGLQEKLGENGIPAVVVYLPEGKMCQQPWFTAAARATPTSGLIRTEVGQGAGGGGPITFRIKTDVPAGDTLVITTSDSVMRDGHHASALSIAMASGQVPPCQVVDAPAGSMAGVPPPPPGAVTSSSAP
jgi:hypothetical protein